VEDTKWRWVLAEGCGTRAMRMRCDCQSPRLETMDTRRSPMYGGSVWRRRRCAECGARWTTYEIRHTYLERLASAFKRFGERVH
jgi:transcriptional regulator NrdR family protein